jgi:hypothetical protein
MIGDFVKRALLPFLGLRKPENPALEIKRGALPAQGFLTANFDQPDHALHSCRVKPFSANQRSSISSVSSHDFHAYCDAEWDSSASRAARHLRATLSPLHQYVIEAPGKIFVIERS